MRPWLLKCRLPAFFRFRGKHDRRRQAGFSLVEMLVSLAILAVLILVLAALSTQSEQMWRQGENQKQYREKARATLDYMGRELRLAVLGADPAKTGLEFVINPSGVNQSNFPNSFFWQAPIATDSTYGNMAEVGYFVRWTGTQPNLCRFFVNPSAPGSSSKYLIYTSNAWVTDSLLTAVAPATSTSHYQGLFLENVIGLWVQGYNVDGSAYGGDSKGVTPNQLPASVEIALAFLDASTVAHLQTATATQIQTLSQSYPPSGSPPSASAAAEQFLTHLRTSLPLIASGAAIIGIRVNLENYR